jgi:hypothetical protein
MGRPREALQFCEQTRSLAERAGNTDYLRVVDAFRARMLQDLDQAQAARRLYEVALERDGRLAPPFPRGVDFVARLHQLRGNTDEAVAVLERDIEQHGNELHNSWDTINRFELAAKHVERGDGVRALAVLAPLGAGFAELTFRWDRDWLRARAHNLAGEPVPAEAAARAALTEAARRGPPDGPFMATPILNWRARSPPRVEPTRPTRRPGAGQRRSPMRWVLNTARPRQRPRWRGVDGSPCRLPRLRAFQRAPPGTRRRTCNACFSSQRRRSWCPDRTAARGRSRTADTKFRRIAI